MGDNAYEEKFKEIFEAITAIREKVEKGASESELKELEEKITKRLTEIETKIRRPILTTREVHDKSEEEKAFFDFYVRKGEVPPEKKDLFVSSDPEGGYIAPVEFSDRLISKLYELSPIRNYATVIPVGSHTVSFPVDNGLPTTYWAGEKDSPVISSGEDFGKESIQVNDLTSEPKVSNKLLQDAVFDVEAYLLNKLSLAFSVAEGQAFVKGDGVNKPEGLLTRSDVAEVASGDAANITADAFLDMFGALKSGYSLRGVWVMNMKTFVATMKLKDSTGDYLLAPNLLSKGAPLVLLGKEVVIAPDMPDIAANSYPVVFGDLKSAYTIVDRMDISVLRDPYTAKPAVLFYTTKRVGGQVVLPEAICKMKISA